MKNQIKIAVQAAIKSLVGLSSKNKIGRYWNEQVLAVSMEDTTLVNHNNLELKFAAPNSLCRFRSNTFSTKEPETLAWIDGLNEGSILWDIGANVGLYSVYAVKKRNCKVFAFEPSVFNLELLARNINLNGMSDQIALVPIALTDQSGFSKLRMTSTDLGGALSTFGKDYGWDGQTIKQVFEFQTLGLSIENVVENLSIPVPDYIKMDVDGIEHLILEGGESVLKKIKGILIEVNDDFHEQASQCELLLTKAGLILKDKLHSEYVASSKAGFQNCFNQIWVRP
jgi:FkbM family methyltransferase